MVTWYYSEGGEQRGPVTEGEMRALVNSGRVDREKGLVWTKGMPAWLAPMEAPGLLVKSGDEEPWKGEDVGRGELSDVENPYAAPRAAISEQTISQPQLPVVKRTNFWLMVSLGVGGVLLAVFGGIIVFAGLVTDASGGDRAGVAGGIILGGFMATILGYVVSFIGWIISLIYLYRAWALLQPRTTYSTPGKAVGFLFIPFFSLYWCFVAYWRWSEEWNRLVASDPAHPDAPKMPEGVFLSYPIIQLSTLVIGGLALIPMLIMFVILLRAMCHAVDYGAALNGEAAV